MNNRENLSTGLLFCLFGGLLNCFHPAQAADHYNLEEGLPTKLEDSLPTAYLNRELQGRFSWEHTRDGEEIFILEPRLEYGIFRNAQVELNVPFWLGDGVEEEGIGDVVVAALYNIHQETLWLPAPSLAAHVIFPTNDDSDGVDTVLKLILSKTIGGGFNWQRVHLNVSWHYNSDAHEDERENYFVGIVGYDRLIGPDTVLVLDFVREQEKEEDQDSNLLEAGIRYQLTPLVVLTAGAAAGIGEDSPDFRTILGFQKSF